VPKTANSPCFVAIDRTSKFAYAEPHPEAIKPVAAKFLRHLIEDMDGGGDHRRDMAARGTRLECERDASTTRRAISVYAAPP
jgi:hypothetical protein